MVPLFSARLILWAPGPSECSIPSETSLILNMRPIPNRERILIKWLTKNWRTGSESRVTAPLLSSSMMVCKTSGLATLPGLSLEPWSDSSRGTTSTSRTRFWKPKKSPSAHIQECSVLSMISTWWVPRSPSCKPPWAISTTSCST